jgi:hypothetical protein
MNGGWQAEDVALDASTHLKQDESSTAFAANALVALRMAMVSSMMVTRPMANAFGSRLAMDWTLVGRRASRDWIRADASPCYPGAKSCIQVCSHSN